MTEVKRVLNIPRAFLGQFAKEVVDLELHYSDETLELVQVNSLSSQSSLPAPWKWSSITGVGLKYTPLGLQRIVLEVDLTRTRETTKALTQDAFVVLFFNAVDIPLVEGLLEKHRLTSFAKEGISDYLLTPPFSYIYTEKIRKAMNVVGKISRIFITLCFVTSLFKWLLYCHPDQVKDGEHCVTYLGYFYGLFCSLLSLAYDVAVTPVLALLEYIISPFPKIKYVFAAMFSLLLLPIWPVIGLWGLAFYLSDFVIRFHILFYVWDALSLAIANYKFFAYLLQTFNQITAGIWNTFRTKKKPTTVSQKVSDLNKKVQ